MRTEAEVETKQEVVGVDTHPMKSRALNSPRCPCLREDPSY